MLRRLLRALTLVVVCALCALPAAAVAPQEVAVPLTPMPTIHRSPDGHAAAGGWQGPLVAGLAPEPNHPLTQMGLAQDVNVQATATPCAAGDCSSATTVACNSVAEVSPTTDQWDTYSCLDTSMFSSLPNSEALLAHTVNTADQDIALAVPEISLTTLGNVFAPILDACDNAACLSGGHTTNWTTWQHAMVSNAPLQSYQMAVESPSVDTFTADALLSCGTHNPGWCEPRVRQTLAPGTFNVIQDTTATGYCDVIAYEDWFYAFDGNEVVYKLVLTQTSFVSITLEYAGDASIPYNNYMAAHVLSADCDQQEEWMTTYLLGEGGYTWAWVWDILPEGTYYVVVDGMYMPCSGDDYTLIVTMQDQQMYMPILREPPSRT